MNLTRPAAKELDLEVVRPLTAEDLEGVFDNRDKTVPRIKRANSRHHALARLIASGVPLIDAGLMTGYASASISVLLDDPTFKELVEFYRRDEDYKIQDLQEKMIGLSSEAADILMERLEETPEKIPTTVLLELMSRTADRTGHGPKTITEKNVNINIAERLQNARKRLTEKVIDHE